MIFSDYIVYADESGDHGLTNINPENPVFVLAFCVFHKETYARTVVPSLQRLKFEFWGHDAIILHSYEIRKRRNDFRILLNEGTRIAFLPKLAGVVENAEFTLIAAAIDKQRLCQRYNSPDDPYEISLAFCMERLQMFLRKKGQADCQTHLLVEKRGSQEDASLELHFRRVADGANRVGRMDNLDIRFMDKKHNSCGLQIADLVAYPIGRHVIKPDQANRAYASIEHKFRRSEAGKIQGYGLKVFP